MRHRTLAWLAIAAIGISVGLTSTARAADANGTWKWSFTRPNGGDTIEISLKLLQDGEKLTGTMTTPNGETEIKDGSVKDGTVTFKVERERDGNKFVQLYNGKLDGDTIKGKSEMEFNGTKRERDWEAKRAK